MTTATSQRICSRCAEPLVNPDRGCGFCIGERREEAVKKLVRAAKSTDSAANLARAEAVSTLRTLGYSQDQIFEARDLARSGHSTEQILEVLGEREAVGA